MRRLLATARRLEGLRSNRTLTVAYSRTNRVRIRFQAPRAGNDPGRDLQPRSRVLTAIVLVRSRAVANDYSLQAQILQIPELKRSLDRLEDEGIKSVKAAQGRLLLRSRDSNGSKAIEDGLKEWTNVALNGKTGDLEANSKVQAAKSKLMQEIFGKPVTGDALRPIEEAIRSGSVTQEDMESPVLAEAYLDFLTATEDFRRSQARVFSDSEVAFGSERILTESDTGKPTSQDQLNPDSIKEWEGVRNQIRSKISTIQQRLRCVLMGRPCSLQVRGFFVPTVWDSSGSWNPPRDLLIDRSRPHDRLCALECGDCVGCRACHPCGPIPTIRSWILGWLGPINIKLEIGGEPTGYYSLSLADLEALGPAVTGAEAALESASKEVERRTAALVAARKEAAAEAKDLRTARAVLELAKQDLDESPHDPQLQAAVRQAEKDLKAVEKRAAVIVVAEREADRARVKRAAAADALATARQAVATERASAIGAGRAVVAFTVDSPPFYISQGENVPTPVRLYARILGLSESDCEPADALACDEGEQCATGRYCPIPVGGRHHATVDIASVDLAIAISGTAPGKPQLRPIRALLEVVLVPEDIDPNEEPAWKHAIQTDVREFVLQPRELIPASPPKAPSGKPTPIEVKLNDVRLKLGGEPKTSN